MKTHWVFRDCEEADKERARAYLEAKQGRLEKLLKKYNPALVELRLTLYRMKNDKWEIRGVLQLPTGTLASHELGISLTEAIEKTLDTLVREVKKHKELVRKDYVYRRRREQRRNLSAAGPLLEQDRAANRKEAFFQLLEPLMGHVYDYARHQLELLELEGVIGRGEVTPRDIVDDVLLRAWEQFAERPKHLDLELWLTTLANQRIEELRAQAQEQPVLDTELPPEAEQQVEGEPLTPDEDVEEVDFWLERIFKQSEPITLADLIPDAESTDVWDELDEREQNQRLAAALAKLNPEEREVLLLHVVDGYEIAEIALIKDQPEEEITKRLEAARRRLCELLPGMVTTPSGT
ncbi:MAG: sigma-70 family RNA polymerase sigma factor [Planctomycetota bacterium]|nr:MAG: sigma-70 family RNA polymerase sigma factor [Planctomycetota bacterium]